MFCFTHHAEQIITNVLRLDTFGPIFGYVRVQPDSESKPLTTGKCLVGVRQSVALVTPSLIRQKRQKDPLTLYLSWCEGVLSLAVLVIVSVMVLERERAPEKLSRQGARHLSTWLWRPQPHFWERHYGMTHVSPQDRRRLPLRLGTLALLNDALISSPRLSLHPLQRRFLLLFSHGGKYFLRNPLRIRGAVVELNRTRATQLNEAIWICQSFSCDEMRG